MVSLLIKTKLLMNKLFKLAGKCADVAKERGFKVFAIQNGGHCMSGPKADHDYTKHGATDKCKNGIGGPTANDVYRL